MTRRKHERAPTTPTWSRDLAARLPNLPGDQIARILVEISNGKGPSTFDAKPRRVRKTNGPPRALSRAVALVNTIRDRISEDRRQLPRLDEACAKAVTDWALSVTEHRPHKPLSPDPSVAAEEAFAIGALRDLDYFKPQESEAIPFTVEWLLRRRGQLTFGGKHSRCLHPMLSAFANHLRWLSRVRRCPYSGGGGCYRFFLDRSPRGEALACKPDHSVRLIESQGPSKPRRKRGVKLKR